MRELAILATALTLWTSVVAQPTRPLVVVIDSNSPIQDANRANELLDLATEHAGVPIYQLTTLGTRRLSVFDIDPTATPSRVAPFSFQPSTYGFVSLTVLEASEILRGNESVRDEVIRRTCRNRPERDCGAAVHVGALALLRDIDSETAKKIRAVTDIAATSQAKTVIIVTAGWPCRDAGQVGVDRAVRQLKKLGTVLAVWRIDATIAYTGLVHDAAQEIASRLAEPTRRLDDPSAAAEVRTQIAGVSGDARDVQPASPSGPPAPTPRDEPSLVDDPTLDKAQSYVTKYVQTFSSVMWREQSRQEDRVRERFNASGGRFLTLRAKRDLIADMVLLWLPRESKWIAVRDVIAVDGVPLPTPDRPAAGAFNRPELSINDLRGLAAQNGRFNIGQIVHTFNEPTLALLFLAERERHHFAFRRGKDEKLAGRSASVFGYDEVVRPTIVQDHDLDVPAHGRVWIDRSSGEVLQTSLELTDLSSRVKGQITVRYGPTSGFDVLVPVEMREVYSSEIGEEITTAASYSNFRRFETAVRILREP